LPRAVLATAAIVTISALLFRAAVPPAYACSCIGQPLEAHVANAATILAGTVTAAPIIPPLDPSTPDELDHRLYINLSVEEYLKGEGPPAMTLSTHTRYYFQDGNLYSESMNCDTLYEGSAGRRHILFMGEIVESPSDPGKCGGSGDLYGSPAEIDAYLQQIRDLVAATPSPTASPSPEATPEATPTLEPIASPVLLPAGLPPTGERPQADHSLIPVTLVAGTLMAAVATVAVRRRTR
jgi:hypothetical protein